MDNSLYWLFVNTKNQLRSKKMSQSKADVVIRGLAKSEIDDWLAWTPIFRDWVALKNLVVVKPQGYELLIQFKSDYIEENSVLNESTVVLSEINESNQINESNKLVMNHQKDEGHSQNIVGERRADLRFDIKVEVLILAKGLSFRAETVNLSKAGAMLSKPIPEAFLGSVLEVVFILSEGKIQEKMAIKGKVLSSRENLKYLTFSNINSECTIFFERLIKNYF